MSLGNRTEIELLVRMALIGIGLFLAALFVYLLFVHPLSAPASHWVWIGRVASVVGIIAVACAFRLSPDARINALLATGGVVAGLGCAEIYLAWSHRPLEVAPPRHEVVERLEREGRDVALALYPLLWRYAGADHFVVDGRTVFPLSGASGVTTVLCNEAGFWAVYESDEHGFNNPWGLHDDGIDVAVLGDSFVHGYCVRPGDEFVSVIRERYPGTLNLGISGAGALTRLAILREYAAPLKPRLLLWVYTENTLHRLDYESRGALPSRVLPSYLDPEFSQGLLARRAELDSLLRPLAVPRALERSTLSMVLKARNVLLFPRVRQRIDWSYARLVGRREDGAQRRRLQRYADILAAADAAAAGFGGQLVFVYLPTRGFRRSSDHAEIVRVVAELGIELIDLYPPMSEHPDIMSLFPFRRLNHFNEKGHALVGELIVEALETRYAESIGEAGNAARLLAPWAASPPGRLGQDR